MSTPSHSRFRGKAGHAFRRAIFAACAVAAFSFNTGCTSPGAPNTVVMLIESSPANLDTRIGSDAQSERIGALVYDSLFRKDEHYNLQPWIAERWEWRDPTTLVLHIRHGVHFHDGKMLDAGDVAWSIDSMHDGTLVTAKAGAFASVLHTDVADPYTCVVHLKRPDASLLFNLSDGLSAIVERGAGNSAGLHPAGTGPFRFVSQVQDKEVLLERNPDYWAGSPRIAHLRFDVVPDAITRALEMQKGSADAVSNGLTADMVDSLAHDSRVQIVSRPGSAVMYLTFNVADPLLRDSRVRQAFAYSVNRDAIIRALWHGHAAIADSLLPAGHWALAPESSLHPYSYNPHKAAALLESAGYKQDAHGIRIRLTLKTSTDESTRLLAAVLQQQVRAAGIELEIRQNEFATFYSDVTRGAFQMYALRWIGSNEDPDIFRVAYSSTMTPPKGSNRGHYANPELDALLSAASSTPDENTRRADYVRVQQILSDDEPTLVLWSLDNVVVHSPRLHGVTPAASGSFDWLRTAWVSPR